MIDVSAIGYKKIDQFHIAIVRRALQWKWNVVSLGLRRRSFVEKKVANISALNEDRFPECGLLDPVESVNIAANLEEEVDEIIEAVADGINQRFGSEILSQEHTVAIEIE